MPRGIPNKRTEALKDIEKELNPVEVKTGEVQISSNPPNKVEGSNELGDEYTLEVLSDNEPGADVLRIANKDPNFEYRFLRDEKSNLSVKTSNILLQKGGWQVVPRTHLKRIKIDEKLYHPDGSYRVGELILAFMPKKLFEKKIAEDRRLASEATAGVKRLVEEGDSSRIKIKDVNAIQPGRMDGGRVVFDNRAKGSVKVKSYGSHNEIEN